MRRPSSRARAGPRPEEGVPENRLRPVIVMASLAFPTHTASVLPETSFRRSGARRVARKCGCRARCGARNVPESMAPAPKRVPGMRWEVTRGPLGVPEVVCFGRKSHAICRFPFRARHRSTSGTPSFHFGHAIVPLRARHGFFPGTVPGTPPFHFGHRTGHGGGLRPGRHGKKIKKILAHSGHRTGHSPGTATVLGAREHDARACPLQKYLELVELI